MRDISTIVSQKMSTEVQINFLFASTTRAHYLLPPSLPSFSDTVRSALLLCQLIRNTNLLSHSL